jgi:hypothetical protein
MVEVFKHNGYKDYQFKKVVLKTRRGHNNICELEEGKLIMIPYIKGTMDTIARILRKGNIRVTFTLLPLLKEC